MKQLICIVCPKGCHLQVDETNDFMVVGAGCEKGVEYGKMELTNPQRTLTSTVKTKGFVLKRLPVKTSAPVPKSKILPIMQQLNTVCITQKVKAGDVLLYNVCQTGVNIVATANL